MSVIETPPKDRLAIHTVVAPFGPELIRSALELELARGGQIYYLHNRVDSIWERAHMLQQLAPGAKIGVGHGQMGEADLEKTMLQFMKHDFDILVCTTIIENGLDIPLANTMLVENAERYGLSELYQLRGRVGRSNRRAYAYLMIPPDTELSTKDGFTCCSPISSCPECPGGILPSASAHCVPTARSSSCRDTASAPFATAACWRSPVHSSISPFRQTCWRPRSATH
ncbi:MAG: helicase-related protein [Ignavibacteriota bacterium]